MSILKGEEALRYYGEKGANGVIVITTKAFRQEHTPVKEIKIVPANPDQKPLFLVDGVELSEEGMKKLNPSDFESVIVLKDQAATAIYGNKGKNGVILITLKKKTSRVQPVLSVETKDGLVTAQADTIKIPSLKMTVYNKPTGN
jgi:bla regulator protein blaR1